MKNKRKSNKFFYFLKNLKNKFIITTLGFTSFAFATDGGSTSSATTGSNGVLGQLGEGSTSSGGGFIKSIIGNPSIKVVLQSIIIIIVLYSIFNIAKEFVGGSQGGGGGVWKNLGAILAAGVLYWLLFIKLGS